MSAYRKDGKFMSKVKSDKYLERYEEEAKNLFELAAQTEDYEKSIALRKQAMEIMEAARAVDKPKRSFWDVCGSVAEKLAAPMVLLLTQFGIGVWYCKYEDKDALSNTPARETAKQVMKFPTLFK